MTVSNDLRIPGEIKWKIYVMFKIERLKVYTIQQSTKSSLSPARKDEQQSTYFALYKNFFFVNYVKINSSSKI